MSTPFVRSRRGVIFKVVNVTKAKCITKPEYDHQVAVEENHVTIIQPYTPTRSTIPQYLRKRRASKCKAGPQPRAVDKPPDQVGLWL